MMTSNTSLKISGSFEFHEKTNNAGKKYSYLTSDSCDSWIFVRSGCDTVGKIVPGVPFKGSASVFVSISDDGKLSLSAYLLRVE